MRMLQRVLLFLARITPYKLRKVLYKAAGMEIGKGARIALGFYTDRPENVRIGNNSFLNHYVHLHNGADRNSRITIGNNVFIGPEVSFVCAIHEIGLENQRAGRGIYGSITVEDGVWIGAGVIILPGVKIARGGVIGAGAVVTNSTEPNGLYLGVPAKRVKDLEN